MIQTWLLQEAKNKFSQVVENAVHRGPQIIKVRICVPRIGGGNQMAKLQSKQWLMVPLALLALVVGGCAGKSTPPGADMAYGSVEGAGYTLMRWQEGLALMIWQRDTNYLMCEGGGSTRDPIYELNCLAESDDGYRLDWTVQTADGQTAQLEMDNATYDLSGGTLFLVRLSEGGIEVIQLDRDLSNLPFDHNQITTFATNDPDIAEFIDSLSTD